MIAQCVGADRVYIWRNTLKDDGELCYTWIYGWLKDGMHPRDKEAELSYRDTFPDWERNFAAGKSINGPVSGLSDMERSRLEPYGIKSTLNVPLFLKDTFWGFASFADCHKERFFSENEESILRSGSLMIVNAILRNEMAQHIKTALERAEDASRAKGNFLATMSHEIRTPMNAIIGMSDLMRTDNLDKIQRGYFEDIKKMSRSLLEIINDSLDFSKIESGKLELVPVHFNIASLFDNIVSLCNFIATGKSLEFRSNCAPDIPHTIYGDEIRIRQIFINVVNNAIKYTREGRVNFTLKKGTWKDSEEEYLIAAVEDSGIGIKDEDKTKLFGSFEQLDTRKNRSITGTGLGLAITKRLLDMMGGFIELESEYGKGSVFTLYIPLVPGDPEQVEQDNDAGHFVKAKEGADIQILVVDDMPINLTVVLGFLARHGMKADTAESGEEAIRMVTERGMEKHYDLVLMDHMMPGVDGVEASHRIRAWEEEQRKKAVEFPSETLKQSESPSGIPIVALSANAVSGARELFLEAGMNDFISKPIEAPALNAVLSKWLPSEKLIHNFSVSTDAALSTENDPLWAELNAIPGLNTEAGLNHTGGSREGYYRVLRQFCSGFDEGMRVIAEDVEKENWKDYAIRLHAYKGVLAMLGQKALSDWALSLEAAGKDVVNGDESAAAVTISSAINLCKTVTAPVCEAIRGFHKALLDTPLIP
jgi:signal transduction histidine kinase/DNA-binding NarL/FixJ family response regulator